MRRLLIITLLVVMVGALALSGCAAPAPTPTPKPSPTPAPAPTPHPEVKMDIWGGPFGGTLYVTGFAFMDTLNKTHPWLRGSIIETKGGWDNVLNSDKDKAKMANSMITSDYPTLPDIINGAAKTWNDAGRTPAKPGDRLVICAMATAAQLMVTFDPNIKSGKDVIGKRVAGWTRGSGAYSTLQATLFAEWGITEKDLKSYDGMELKAKTDALSDGLVDAIHLSEPFVLDKPTLTSPNLAELLTSPKPLYNIPVTKQEADAFVAKMKASGDKSFLVPWKVLPAGHYSKNWPQGGTNIQYQIFWCYKELPEEIQYEIAKTLIEKSDDIAAHGGAAALMVPSVLVGALPVASEAEVAPGALKYYKEKGIWTKYPPDFLKK